MWCKLFDGTSKVMSFAELQDLQCRLKDMPIERFENDRDLKSLVCVGIYAVMTCLAGFPSNLLKKKKFFVKYDCEANMLEVRML